MLITIDVIKEKQGKKILILDLCRNSHSKSILYTHKEKSFIIFSYIHELFIHFLHLVHTFTAFCILLQISANICTHFTCRNTFCSHYSVLKLILLNQSPETGLKPNTQRNRIKDEKIVCALDLTSAADADVAIVKLNWKYKVFEAKTEKKI